MARRRLPPLKALPAFEEAARHLSFSAAARELNLTHGAISRQMKSLETHLGVRLFRRLNRRVELTDAGAAFLPATRTALDVVEASAARLSTATRQGPLVVSCLPTFMMRWLIPRLYDFNARHPAIDVRLSASSAPVDFAREGVDVAIRIGAGPWPDGVEAHAFMNEEIGPVCSPALAERGKLRRSADLGRHALLHTETRADAWADWLARVKTANIDAPKGQRFEHFYFLLEAAVAGLGVAVAPKPLVMEDLKLGRLVAPFGFVKSGRQYCLLYPTELAAIPKIRIFRAWIGKSR
ncbi:transcriptional regulator GcvA [Reyranella soli]|uniref:LysR family transcriptional regulator n=1 Tax=Reyranella soli TaxID=1230389 RepID=A0A512N3Y8_9HYPH|nr:transcriptional regulator GcvA [Reyranella soli]GEP53695.1 LysR family transcriptional regulator [Reyranella soli]